MKKKKSFSKLYLYGAIGCIAVIAIVGYIYCFSSFSKSSNTEYVYIDSDDNIDSVYNKLRPFAKSIPFQAFKTLTLHSGYADHIRTGRYAIAPGDGSLKTWRHMKNGLQEPVSLTIPSVRTLDKLSDEIGKKMMFGSNDLYHALRDESVCQKYGYDTATIACMFVPNTYDLYWNISVDKFLERMKKESDKFWNFERTEKAKAMKLMASKLAVAGIIEGTFSEEGLAAMSDVKDLTSQMAKELALGIRDNVEDIAAAFRKMAVMNPERKKNIAAAQLKETAAEEQKAPAAKDSFSVRTAQAQVRQALYEGLLARTAEEQKKRKSKKAEVDENQLSIFGFAA